MLDAKSIPTDSYYKFWSVFCLTLILASVYAISQIEDRYDARRHLYDERIIQLQSDAARAGRALSAVEQKLIDTYKFRIEHANQERARKSEFCAWAALGALLGAFWGFGRWKYIQWRYYDRQLHYETEILRHTYEQKLNSRAPPGE